VGRGVRPDVLENKKHLLPMPGIDSSILDCPGLKHGNSADSAT
jgi:hypothetical protein